MSKILRISAFFLILYASLQWVQARDFRDVEADHPNHIAVDYLSDQEVIRGQGESTRFDPDGLLNRAEWPVILARQAQTEPELSQYSGCFPDVSTEWFAPAVCYAVEQGWVKGYQAGPQAGRYIPTNTLTLAEVLVMLERRFDWNTEPGEDWFTPAYTYAFEAGIISPGEPLHQAVTRAEATEILFRSIAIRKFAVAQYDPLLAELLVNTDSTSNGADSADGKQNIQELPIVTVSPFPDQPDEALVVSGATYVPVLRFSVEVSKPVILEQFAIRRVSVGRTEDLSYTRLFIDGDIIEEKTFSGDSESVVWRNIDYHISPNGAKIFEISVDFVQDATKDQYYQFRLYPESLQFSEPVEVNGDVFEGEVFKTSEIAAKNIVISNPDRALNKPFTNSVGETIGRFNITAGEHDVLIKRVRLEGAEDINNGYFSNFRLTVGSQEVAQIEELDRNILDFFIDDYFLDAGKTRTFTIRADVGNARINDSVRFYLDHARYAYALDVDYNYGVQVVNEFGFDQAWCVGSESVECPVEGLRKRCDKDDAEAGVRDCEEDEEEDVVPEVCDDRLAPVCGQKNETSQTYTNRCWAEQDGATGILPGPCE